LVKKGDDVLNICIIRDDSVHQRCYRWLVWIFVCNDALDLFTERVTQVSHQNAERETRSHYTGM